MGSTVPVVDRGQVAVPLLLMTGRFYEGGTAPVRRVGGSGPAAPDLRHRLFQVLVEEGNDAPPSVDGGLLVELRARELRQDLEDR